MDGFKSKIFDLIHLQGNVKIPIVGNPVDFTHEERSVQEKNGENVANRTDRPSDQEILESVDAKYFNESSNFDAGKYELQKFENIADISKIESHLQKLKQQQLVVSNNVLQMILEKQSACQEEFNRILEVQTCVEDILKDIKSGRDKLDIATRHFTTASLGILANYRKRTLVQQLLRSLNTIKTLHQTEFRMSELLQLGDFPGAIALLLECQGVAAMYRHFNCVAALNSKLQDTLVMAEEHLDVALAKICYEFDEEIYKKLQSAYFLLGKTQTAMDQLHMHFTSAVHNTAFNVVLSFVECSSPSGAKMQYAQLCKEIEDGNLILCLLSLCKALWCIVLSYYQVVCWHQKHPQNSEDTDFESNYNEQYVKQKLNNGLTRLWHDVQTRVSTLVLAANLANYKFDDFLQVLSILHRLSEIGEELCGSDSEEVTNSVRTQSSNYFSTYHATKLDDLKVFFENEAWTHCPVRSDFSFLHLQEFRGLRCSVEQCAGVQLRHDTSIDSSSVGANFFNRFPDPKKRTPFDSNFHMNSTDEDILANAPEDPSGYFSEESEDDEIDAAQVSQDLGKEKELSHCSSGPLLTNTTLTVLRLCGKYLQMSRLLKFIASEVVMALTQLFEYYLYTVYVFFTSDLPITMCPNIISLKLQAVLNRIKENLIQDDEMECNKKTVAVSLEMRKPVYACVSWRLVDARKVLNMMSRVDWEVKDVMSQHSKYVDYLIMELQLFHGKLSQLKTRLHVPEPAENIIWENVIYFLANLFVEGFSSSKKCSNGGRALMQLDFIQLISKLEKLCSLRPIPHREYVEAYVKAYYQPEDDLESWIKDHSEYTSRHLTALACSACQNNKKTRQRLCALIDELEKSAIR
ncbi:vacuolar protein sorting 50 isoform X2 [Rhodnius prolixus]|uniref:vacuolar protein sorting 50 isoform X2 n=1 Tax=Rhodnius prolixus TaxID=13249 RepID=UPI003D18D140